MLTQSTWGGLTSGAAGSGPLPSIPSGYIFDESQTGDVPISAADRNSRVNSSGRPVDATCTNWDGECLLDTVEPFLSMPGIASSELVQDCVLYVCSVLGLFHSSFSVCDVVKHPGTF